jgi:predicted nucleic acid-binding protein
MKNKIKLYLDTSVISALFDHRNPERQLLTQDFFDQLYLFEVFISELTIIEIEQTQDNNLYQKMNDVANKLTVIPLDDDIQPLVNEYLEQNLIPKNYIEDAYHIAIAVLNSMDYIVSWNFKHIVRKKTKDLVHLVSTINNLPHVEIITPPELL